MKILNTSYDNLTVPEAVERIITLAQDDSKISMINFVNADCIYKAYHDKAYSKILSESDLVLPDGIGVKLTTALFGEKMKDNCNGTDLSPLVLKAAAMHDLKVFFLGGKEGRAKMAGENAERNYGTNIVGTHHGYFTDNSKVIKLVNDSKADILFVALGVPYQEKWVHKHCNSLHVRACLSVGAYLDYLSGQLPRAPKVFRLCNLEWLWRVFVDPKRMVKRYFIDGACFIGIVLKERLCSKR